MKESDLSSTSTESLVLGKAAVKAGDRLGLPDSLLATLLAVDVAKLRALRKGLHLLEPEAEQWRNALMLVRIYEGLLCVVSNDYEARRWLSSENLALGGQPIDLLTQQGGLDGLLLYLDAARAVG
ncbi:antitoxin Xre/MbcA/ParS toxin-binding domain-containing protein [Pseudomonas sp. EA_105y_Pfl2_R69]|uniref:antitoxin Xre/MbcA/ParS toxin-binding domain-containing protein n=1 Tax=Pseudomonas sp. EA_105y_Pfl2_R69 TaxID=3088683 RepID=UPI0030D98B2F